MMSLQSAHAELCQELMWCQGCATSEWWEVTMPGSDAHVTQIPLTDQASSGCCSSAPSKLAWLVETGVQYVLQRAALLHMYAAAQSASCLPAAGGCRRLQSCIAESSGGLSNVLNTRCGSCLDHCLLQHVSPIKQPVTRSEALTTSASAAEAARHICVAARHRAEPGTLVGSPLGLMSHACQTLLCRDCILRVPPPTCSCLSIIRCHVHPASAAGVAWGVQGSHSWRVEPGPPGLWRQAEGRVQLPCTSACGVLPPLPAHGGAPVPLGHRRELLQSQQVQMGAPGQSGEGGAPVVTPTFPQSLSDRRTGQLGGLLQPGRAACAGQKQPVEGLVLQPNSLRWQSHKTQVCAVRGGSCRGCDIFLVAFLPAQHAQLRAARLPSVTASADLNPSG